MSTIESRRVGYVLKRYPRYSETFIVNELLAHEAAGLEIEIFALRPVSDTHFQDRIARVRAPVTYLPHSGINAAQFWSEINRTAAVFPDIWSRLKDAAHLDVRSVYQGMLLAREVHHKKIDHLHSHFATVSTTVARIAAAISGRSYSFTAHAKDIFHESVDPHDLKCKLSDASSVITVSDYNVAHLRDRFENAAAGVRRVYNGLDLADFPFRSPDERSPTIVSVGRLVEKKGFPDLIDACAILVSRNRNFSCTIIGTGELKSELQDQIDRLNLNSTVQLLGPRPQMDVIRAVQEASLFAAPCVVGGDSNRDGLPTVLLEAMALGTPCVSTDVTGIPEVVHHERTGLMTEQHDSEGLANCIERLLDDGELRVRLATEARRLIEAEFDIHLNTRSLREAFTSTSDTDAACAAKSWQETR